MTIKRGTFEKLVFDKLSNNNFEFIDIGKNDMETNIREQIYIKSPGDIGELTKMLSKLKMLEVKVKPDEDSVESSYYIDFVTEDKEYIYLKFYQPSEYIAVGIDGENHDMEKVFKITDGSIDLTLLNKLISN